MSNTLHRFFYSLLVYYISCIKLNLHTKSVQYQFPQYLYLNLTHDLCMYFLYITVPHNMKLRLLLLKLAKL